jgi:hypothetical protein
MEWTTYFYNGFIAMIRVKHFLTELEDSIKGLAKTKEPNTIWSCVIKSKWENVIFLFLLWPLYHIYGVCYVYYFLINIYGIMIISINLDYRKYGIG